MNLTSSCLLILASALSFGASGCATACTDVGCSNQVELTVAGVFDHVSSGSAVLKVCTHDGCPTFDIKREAGKSTCAVHAGTTGFTTCSVLADQTVQLSIEIAAEPPASVSVSLTPDGDAPVERTATLGDPTSSEPNGPGCDPTCHSAKSTVSL